MKKAQILNYKIDSEIGRGGMATIYKAKHINLGIFVAIKVLDPVLATKEIIRERFTQEAKILASLSHKGITKIIDIDESENHVAIVMEYLQGQTLNEYINEKGALSSNEAKQIFLKILEAFDYAHNNGVIHRDIKPSNIFLTHDGNVKIMDFGIAKLKEEGAKLLTRTGTQMGTPVYMSPEQVNDSKHIDHLTDIYSLGVCLWMMLTGKTPYDAKTDSMFAIYNKIVSELLETLKDVELNAIVQKATSKNKDNRYKNCKDFANSIKREKAEQNNDILLQDKNIIEDEITIIENDNDMSNKPAEWFNTEERRTLWWNQLEDQWKRTFNLIWKERDTVSKLDDETIRRVILNSLVLILVGKDGEQDENIEDIEMIQLPFELSNLQGIENLTNLICLEIKNNKLTSLKGIENLTNLTSLDVCDNKLTSLKGIENLTNLRHLDVNYNKLTSLKGIENLFKLETLPCNNNKLKSIEEIKNLIKIDSISVSNNKLTSLKGIKKLFNLENLYCENNQLKSIKEIKNLKNLENLVVSNNSIVNLSGIENITNLGMFFFEENSINSLHELEIMLKNHNTNEIKIQLQPNPIRKLKRGFWKADINEAEYLEQEYPWMEIYETKN